MDDIDRLLQECITKGCKEVKKNAHRVITKNDVDELNRWLREEHQLKAYFTLSSEIDTKGGIPEFSRITIHTTILVQNESDIHYFENIGHRKEIDYNALVKFILYDYNSNPIYTLQEHPLVHGIVSFKNVVRPGVVYFLYRHDNNLEESILATVNIETSKVSILQGKEYEQQEQIVSFIQAVKNMDNYSPFYQCAFIKELGSGYPATFSLNKERKLFTDAKMILMNELINKQKESFSYANMFTYLKRIFEA